MSIDRPTFSESWHRIAGLRCRLRTGVRVVRQRYRGQTWHVLQDPAANQYFRLSDPAYFFVGLLDSRRTIADAWTLTNQRAGDEAPTQGEIVQLLGQLHTSNLLAGDLPGDALAVFKRSRRRVARELRGYLANILFLRIPLFDPDAFLTRWHSMFSWVFSRFGLVLWFLMLIVGALHLPGREKDLASHFAGVLAADNLFLLYIVFAFIKFIHEFAHAFACKIFGLRESSRRPGSASGEVRTMGVMLMVLMPMPYVDASSSWAFRSKTSRILVASAGIMAELFLAAIAAVVWARSAEGGIVNALAFNALVTASISTLIFNGNPLLRYDGYYILSELIEIPNLATRSGEYIRYLVKKHIWRIKRTIDPSTTPGERAWFIAYAPASLVYRVFVFGGIIIFLAQQWFIIGVVFALVGLITWLLLPSARYIRYLFTSPELARNRPRALTTSAIAFTIIAIVLGAIPMPDRVRVDGVVEPVHMAVIHARTDGFIAATLPSGTRVAPDSSPLVEAQSRPLLARQSQLTSEIDRLTIAYQRSLEKEPALTQQLAKQLAAIREQLSFVSDDLRDLNIRAALPGTWVSPHDDLLPGSFAKRGTQLGLVADLDTLMVRAVATQDAAARLIQHHPQSAEVRIKGRPQQLALASVQSVLPAGQEQLPSRALGFSAGGSVETDPTDQHGEKARQQFFEIRLALPPADPSALILPGQRVVARFDLPPRPLALQGWHALLQLLQRRFRI